MQESGEEWNVESTGGQPAAFTCLSDVGLARLLGERSFWGSEAAEDWRGARGELFYPPQVPNDSLVTIENAKNSMWQYMINIWVGCL